MKITILTSIKKKPQFKDAVLEIISILEKEDHDVFHKHITSHNQRVLDSMSKDDINKFHTELFKNIKSSDLIISEISSQSWGVGYLLAHAESLDKPIISFYHETTGKQNLYSSLTNRSDNFFLVSYKKIEELETLVKEYVEYASDQLDIRFNMMLPPSLSSYLSESARNDNVSKAHYLRNLLVKDKK